jgi:uncharacterized protein YerC
MGKFTNTSKLSKTEQNELFVRFARVLAAVRSSVEGANLIRDLLSEPEALMLARRLQIAELLNEGYTYAQIKKVMKVSQTTIAKVGTWLQVYGEGYRAVFNRTKTKTSPSILQSPWKQMKRKYPIYFWPQLLLEEIVKSANKKEKERLLKIVESMKEKTKLSKDLLKLLR